MTLGVAGASWTEQGGPSLILAADSRYMIGGHTLTDSGVKTYALGGACAIVAAGGVIPALVAAEMTRSLVEMHNGNNQIRPLTFLDTVRFVSFFLRRVAIEVGVDCHAVAAGFADGGVPCLADIKTSSGKVAFKRAIRGTRVALPVGVGVGSALVAGAMAAATLAAKPPFEAAIGALYYATRHGGTPFATVGGGISVGLCQPDWGRFRWPHVEIDGHRYYRGMDLTSLPPDGWPAPERVPYDEGWFATLDQDLSMPDQELREPPERLPVLDIDAIRPEDLFRGGWRFPDPDNESTAAR